MERSGVFESPFALVTRDVYLGPDGRRWRRSFAALNFFGCNIIWRLASHREKSDKTLSCIISASHSLPMAGTAHDLGDEMNA